ncbi:rhodanese-like domain-containing protein [Arthrobacter sp. JCM 19049]|uniref:rhodanese-like domain-containing protein n=1 Tax=Arthrobacter sp. JCM 19049 TaxID=1460643 RepID=UPI0006CFFB90|nr:rhodanese-like domain-containing protein [Arthrobacter sp. JCM 19049]
MRGGGLHHGRRGAETDLRDRGTLIGRFWRYDALQATTDILRFAADPHRQPVTELQDYEHRCALPATVRQIDAGQLQDGQGRNQVLVVDVREAWEREMGSIPGSVHIPLERLTEQGWAALDGLATADQLVLACKSGVRSQRAARILSEERPDAQVFSLQGGTVQWFEEVRGRTLVY